MTPDGVLALYGRPLNLLSLVPWFFSLRDTLVSYMETKDSEIPPELEHQFPEKILLCSCVPVWGAAAELKQGRQAG